MLNKNKLETTLFTHQVFQASVPPVKQTERKLEIDVTKVSMGEKIRNRYNQVLFVCFILFFTSTQQSFSYAGRVFLG